MRKKVCPDCKSEYRINFIQCVKLLNDNVIGLHTCGGILKELPDKVSISTDIGVHYQDEPPWRSYYLETSGDTLIELIDNAQISEIDQDGDEIRTYELNEASNEVIKAAEKIIHYEASELFEEPCEYCKCLRCRCDKAHEDRGG